MEAMKNVKNWRVNQRFLSNLRGQFGKGVFTNDDAYKLYHLKHEVRQWYWKEDWHNDGLMCMNVRNTLCAAAYRGLLTRVGVGQYRFE